MATHPASPDLGQVSPLGRKREQDVGSGTSGLAGFDSKQASSAEVINPTET